MTLQSRNDMPSSLQPHARFGEGIEQDATIIEIRLALVEYRERHSPDHWRLYVPTGRA